MNICRIKLITILFFSLIINQAFAEKTTINTSLSTTENTNLASSKIKGKVTDEKTNTVLDFATVSLISTKTNKQVKAAQTDLNGNFTFNSIASGTYKVTISFIGYTSITKTFSIDKQQKELNLGSIKLKKSNASVLKEVVVTGKKDAIQLGIDRKVFNADESLATQGGTATDLLATVPSVQVDLDGNVSLRGTSNVKILIDGKPSTFGGGDVNSILQSLPANAIEKVELITNPSAKYDPEGQSGIINIVLKKSQRFGTNGNVSISAGRLNNYNFNGGLNFRNEKWNFSGNYSYRDGKRKGFGLNNTTFFNSRNGIAYTEANQESLRKDKTHTLKLGAEYYFSEQTSLALSGNLNTGKENSREDLNQLFFDDNKNIVDRGPGFNNETEKDYGYDLNLDLFHKFKNKGEEINANIAYGNRGEDEYGNIVQNFYDNAGNPSSRLGIDRINDVNQKGSNVNLQVDYTKPLSKTSKLEAGYRSTFKYNDEDQISDTLILGTTNYGRDNNLTSLFELEDIVHAVYTNYQQQFTPNFGAQIGLRAEQAYLNTTFTGKDINGNTTVTPGKLDYFRVYPSIFLTQKFEGQNQVQLSYSRRVNRPRGWQINPFPDVSDRYNISIGNPNLKPEDIHSFELGYSKFWRTVTFTSAIYFRQVNDVVQGIREENPDQNGGTISRFYNIARNRSTGLELIARADITKAWNITSNLNFFQTYFKGDESLGINDNDGFNWNGNLTSSLSITKNLSAQANLFYMAPRTTSQGKTKDMLGLDGGLRYFVMNRKVTLGLNMQDILNTRRFGKITTNNQFNQEFERRRQGQMYNFSISYRFGKSEPSQAKKPQRREGAGGEGGDMERF